MIYGYVSCCWKTVLPLEHTLKAMSELKTLTVFNDIRFHKSGPGSMPSRDTRDDVWSLGLDRWIFAG